jgi:prepilin-type N-terminal cleavage/methylation domain-containing protein
VRDDGFTLMEVLIASTLLAFLSISLLAGLRFGSNIWLKSQSRNVDANAMRMAERALTEHLSGLYPKFVTESPTVAYVAFDGAAGRMSFLSTATSGTGHIARATLETGRDGTLRLTMVPELARPGATVSTETLARNVASAEFAYFGAADGEQVPSWHASWRNQRTPPSLIRIRVAFAGGGVTPWPEMIIAPRIAADAGCLFDALTKFCRGRS